MQSSNFKSEFVKKSVAVLLCAALFLGVLFSAFYIAHEYEHDCTGEDCPICQYIAECEAFVNQISAGVVFICTAVILILAAADSILMETGIIIFDTLVSCKVRLNN